MTRWRGARVPCDLPDFREYARKRYPAELDEDLVTMVEERSQRD